MQLRITDGRAPGHKRVQLGTLRKHADGTPVVSEVVAKWYGMQSRIKNQLPSVSIDPPEPVSYGNSVVFMANTSDVDGSVVSVEYLVDGISKGVSTDAGNNFAFQWTVDQLGNLSVVARATDNDGGVTESESAILEVINSQHTVANIWVSEQPELFPLHKDLTTARTWVLT